MAPAATAPRQRRAQRRSRLFLVFTVGGGLLLVFGLMATILPALFMSSSSSDSSSVPPPPIQVTPGAQESEMRGRLQKNPNDVNAMVVLAGLLANDGQSDEAVQWYDKAVGLRPTDADLRMTFGELLTERGDDLDAEIQLKKAQELAPTNPEPLYLLGQLYQHSDPPRPTDATLEYQQVLQMAPTSVYAQRAKDALTQMNATPSATPAASPAP